jgi:hypothetical protein
MAGVYAARQAIPSAFGNSAIDVGLDFAGVPANSLKGMVGPCGFEPQTSTVSNSETVKDGATSKEPER